ncbi:hypothetical protein FYJ85_21995 [Victivallaceae bacterium BBE-744-WT-12]|uniref:Lipoprotein n=1 Tax=Victivallis lenta TaxID=2606640 RepID=A0A844G8L5_9BACT|nr:hypothetical protein [Victivallis lenta]MST99706.1 hypothetical protein [Victivallis lenta]
MKNNINIIFLKKLILFVICCAFLGGCKKQEMVPDSAAFARLHDAGFSLPENAIVLFYYTSNGRDGDYNEWVIYFSDKLKRIPSWDFDSESYIPEENLENCTLIADIINECMDKSLKKAYQIQMKDFKNYKRFSKITPVGEIAGHLVETKLGYYLRITII